MVIKTVRIRNFRSFIDSSIDLENLTALVGANGSGKSSVLCAIEVFYGQITTLTPDDFYNRETNREIAIALTCSELPEEAKTSFTDYMEKDELTLERVIRWDNGKALSRIHGLPMHHGGFDAVRGAESATDKKQLYGNLRDKNEYSTLPGWKNLKSASDALEAWEEGHPEACSRQRDDGQFFNFRQGGDGDLHAYTQLLFIPAVRNVVSDAVEGRGAVVTSLLDMVVRSELFKRPEMAAIQAETLQKYKAALSPDKNPELRTLGERLSKTLQVYAPSAVVRLDWQPINEIEMPAPKAYLRVVEDDFETTPERTGHGVQRAFILTLLQHLALVESDTPHPPPEPSTAAVKHPSLVLAIEEPELYQHPNRQRHLANVLKTLATSGIPGVAKKTQVIYTTHSPLLVGLDRFNQVRICRKVRSDQGQPKHTSVASTTLDLVAKRIWEANGSKGAQFTGDSLLPRLQAIMNPMLAEGFFAEVVVLVEGEDDQAAVMAAARVLGKDLNSLGISVIACRGKQSMDRPAAIFRELGIPTYLVWDSDEGKAGAQAENNRRLLRLLGETVQDWPSGQNDKRTIFKGTLETTLRAELGPADYDRLVQEALKETDLPQEQGLKNPSVFETILRAASNDGKQSQSLNGIIAAALVFKA